METKRLNSPQATHVSSPIINQPPSQEIKQSAPPHQGLEYLQTADQLLVKQLVGRFRLFCGYENRNRFAITDTHGQKVYFAWEYTDACAAECCVSWRAFEMNVMDNDGNLVMRFKHPDFRYMEIEAPPDTVVGFVERQHCITPSFVVRNLSRQIVLCIEGPLNTGNFRGNVNFDVLAADGSTNVGRICKQWSGLLKEMFTDADDFEITFPAGCDVNVKASLLGALFMIDMMYYENNACPFLHV